MQIHVFRSGNLLVAGRVLRVLRMSSEVGYAPALIVCGYLALAKSSIVSLGAVSIARWLVLGT